MPDSPDSLRPHYTACFSPPAPADGVDPLSFPCCSAFEIDAPPKLLFGRDPYLLSGLLSSIRSEAANRRLAVSAVYDPYLPHRLTALSVEGIGNFTLSPSVLTVEGGLVDCTLPHPEGCEEALSQIRDLSMQKCALAKEIASVGRILADAKTLLTRQGSRLSDCIALRAKGERIAKKLPRSSEKPAHIAVQSYGEAGAVTYHPFPLDGGVRILGLPSRYSLAALFLDALSEAMADRGCFGIWLTAAFTGQRLGVLLPDIGVCYLTDAPEEIREKELTLYRFLHPFTAEERRSYRRLADASDTVEAHLCRRLAEYRSLADRERELLMDLHSESRLQTLRKRLLIELFCSEITPRGGR